MKRELLERLQRARRANRPAVVLTAIPDGRQVLLDGGAGTGDLPLSEALRDVANGALRDDKSRIVELPDLGQVFVQPYNPPLRMIVVGAVHIAQALAPIAALAGYAVTIVDPRRSFASAERFPGVAVVHEWPDEAMEQLAPDARTAIVTLTHDPKIDDPALERALRSPVFYIGCLGSSRTHRARLERLAAAGFGESELRRLHGPVGLDIDAQSPAEIAISIVAEIVRELRREREPAAPRVAA